MGISVDKLLPESQVVKAYMSAKTHGIEAKVAALEDKLKLTADQTFIRLNQENQKAAKKKQQENQDFGNALELACILIKIKLTLFYEKMITEMIKTFHDDKAIAERYQRYLEKLANPDNPYPLLLPQQNQSVDDYQKQVMNETKNYLEHISIQQQETRNRITQDWGAETFEAGLKIQTEIIHGKLAQSINKLEFLNVVQQSDGSTIDLTKIDPEVAEKARNEFNKVNDSLQTFLNERTPTSPVIIEDDNPYVNPEAPQAPAIEETITPSPKITFARRSQLEIDADLFFIKQSRDAFKNIGEPLIEKNLVPVDGKTTIDKNSNLRLAVRVTDTINEDIKALDKKINNFQKDNAMLNQLTNLKTETQEKINKMETIPELKEKPRPR
jgi:hypothetical protein